jgi:DHA1 family multidrug resistance protein-like MFS transporter
MGTGSLILFLTAAVHTPYQLLVLRLIHGCFSGFACASIALIAAESPVGSMGFGMGVFQSSLTAGFIIGPFLGGVLQDFFGIRRTIVGGGVILLVGTALVLFFVTEKNKPHPLEIPGGPFSNARYILDSPTLWPAAKIQFLSNLSMMLVQPLLALAVEGLARAASPFLGTMSGLVISASAISMMFGAPFWGRISDTYGQKKILSLCLMASGLMFIPQGLARTVTQLFLARLLLGFFAAGISPSLQAVIAHHAPAERRAGVLGISFSITIFGNAIGPLVGGLLASSLGLRIPFYMVAVLLVATGLLSQRLHITLAKPRYAALNTID